MRTNRFPQALLLLALLIALLTLVGCRGESEPAAFEATPVSTSDYNPVGTSPNSNAVPASIVVKTALRPAIDPACLEEQGRFSLVAAPMPEDGLEPGMVHVFCAVGAPVGEIVTFTLQSPDNDTQTFQVASVDQGGVSVAVQPITIGADAMPGTWTLTAAYQDQSDKLTFQVKKATQPFLVLAEPIPDDPAIIKVAVGGLAPNAYIHFAVYRLQPGQTEDGMALAQGELLIENLIQVDEEGRADVQLDVADQPNGPYLLALFPPDQPASAATVIRLPEQERMALAINIHRGGGEPGQVVTEQPEEVPAQPVNASPDTYPPAPVLVEGSGGLPETISLTLPEAALPACQPSATPTLQMWPGEGEVGQWWYGCAAGFAPKTPLRVDAVLGNGTSTSFDLTATDDRGVKTFRWYALPSEGAGEFAITISDTSGNQARAQWRIDATTSPHVLVYPHVVINDVGAELLLTGFPARGAVRMGVYRLSDGNGVLVQSLDVKVDKNGAFQEPFRLTQDLEPGIYAVLAQSAPTYQFAGINTPATAIEFFSVGVPLPEKYEFYTLFLGREPGGQVATGQESVGEVAVPSTSGMPTILTIPVDNSPPPTCPDAEAGKPAICMMPTTTQRATYVYMLMHGFKPGTKFVVTVTTPKGVVVKLNVKANDVGIADAHWYALNNEKLGTYRVRIRGGKMKFSGAFKVVKATSPQVVVQPRSPQPGTPVIISVSGLKANTTYVLARYRSKGEVGGQVQFELLDTVDITTGKGGGAQVTFNTSQKDAGTLFLATVYEKDGSQPLAKEVYAPGLELYLRYPFAWGQNSQEGN